MGLLEISQIVVSTSHLSLRKLQWRGLEHTLEGMTEVGVISKAASMGDLADVILGIFREQALRLVHADGKDIVSGGEPCHHLYLTAELCGTGVEK